MAAGINRLRDRYSEHICHVLDLMLKFYEKDRPSCIELHKVMQRYPEFTRHEGDLNIPKNIAVNDQMNPTQPSNNFNNRVTSPDQAAGQLNSSTNQGFTSNNVSKMHQSGSAISRSR